MKKVKINKGKVKNITKNQSLLLKYKLEYSNLRRGSATIETVIVIGISMVLVISIFFPQITNLFSQTMFYLNTWFNTMISTLNTSI